MKKVSIGELMGKRGSDAKARKLTLDDLPELLGDKLPVIKYNPVGRLRLMSALRIRFGDGYRHIPGVDDIIKEFDAEAAHNVKLQEMKLIKGGK